MKRISLLAAIMLLSALVSMAYHFESGGVYYEAGYNDVYWVSRNPEDPYSGKVVIPDYVEYNGDRRKVDAILAGAFYGCEHLTAITLPETLTSIGEGAFEGCTALKSVKLPSGITYLARRAFQNCTSLEEVTLPGSLGDEIGNHAFDGCSSLKRVVCEEGLTQLQWGVFSGCTSLESVQLPQSLRAIDNDAFSGCINLTSLDLPKNLIGLGGQSDLQKITSIDIPKGLKTFGGLPGSSIEEITLPEGITVIENYAFAYCKKLKYVTCHGLLTSIGSKAFYNCVELEAIPHDLTHVTSIGRDAFEDCKKIVELIFSDNLTNIGYDSYYPDRMGVFSGCESLRKVELGNNVREIPQMCFFRTAIREFKVPENCEIIGARAFCECEKLESIILPAKLKSMGELTDNGYLGQVFQNCTSLRSIEIPEGIEVLESELFGNCTSLQSIKLPSTLRHIKNYVFYGSPMTEIELPLGLLSIGTQALYLQNIKELTIPYTVKEMGNGWLRGAALEKLIYEDGEDPLHMESFSNTQLENLKEVYFGRPIKSDTEYIISDWYAPNLESMTFGRSMTDATQISPYGWLKLMHITSKALTPPAIGEFYPEVYQRIQPLVPTEALDAYKNAENWKNFYSFATQDGLGVDAVTGDNDEIKSIYNLNGVNAGTDIESLPAGYYIVKTAEGARKVIVRK